MLAFSRYIPPTPQAISKKLAEQDLVYAEDKFYFRDLAKPKSVEQGSPVGGLAETNYGMGLLYYFGNGVDQDYKKAMAYFMAAFKAGNLEACQYIAEMYLEGNGTDPDRKKALYWYGKCVETGDPVILRKIDELVTYFQKSPFVSTAVAIDRRRFFEQLSDSASPGVKDESKSHSQIDRNSSRLSPSPLGFAEHLFSVNTQQVIVIQRDVGTTTPGSTSATPDSLSSSPHSYFDTLSRASSYESLIEIEGAESPREVKNTSELSNAIHLCKKFRYEEALPIIKKYADNGNESALLELGYTYLRGIGGIGDHKLAFEYYKKAAEHGCQNE